MAYISLKACIPLRVGNESFHPVKSCWVFLYSGFVVLTLLQVLSLVKVTGPLSQALRLSSLKLLLTWRIKSVGRTWYSLFMLFCVSTVWKTPLNSVSFSAAKLCCDLVCKTLKLIILLPLCCYGCMNPTTYVWVTCRDPWICGLSGSYGMPDSLLF